MFNVQYLGQLYARYLGLAALAALAFFFVYELIALVLYASETDVDPGILRVVRINISF